MPRPSRSVLLLVAITLFAGACKKKPPVTQVTPTPSGPTTPPTSAPPRTPPTGPTIDPNEVARKIAEARRLVLEPIYFEYDASELRADAQASLTAKLPILTANPQVRIRVNGHCDERGSDEYNIALGRRRAEMAKRFLTDRGIDASRIETFSFGRERPAMAGSSEESWAKNRRDEFEIIAGGDQIKAP